MSSCKSSHDRTRGGQRGQEVAFGLECHGHRLVGEYAHNADVHCRVAEQRVQLILLAIHVEVA